MDEKPKPTMVSRLPKFGPRAPGGAVYTAMGQVQPVAEGKIVPQGALNGTGRLSSLSVRWRKGNGSLAPPLAPGGLAGPSDDGPAPHCPWQLSPSVQEMKKGSSCTVRQGQLSCRGPSAGPLAPSLIPRSFPSGPVKPGHASSGAAKPVLNGLGGAGRNGSSLPRPRAGSGSAPARSSSRDGLSRSQDSLKPLPPDSMVRSQSLTHVRPRPSPAAPPIPRSLSFSRALELARPLADTQLRTKTPVLRPAPPSTGRPGVAPGCSTPPSPIKKLLVPNCVLSKPSLLGYRLNRPNLAKLPRPLSAAPAPGGPKAGQGGVDSFEASPVTPDTPNGSEWIHVDLPLVTGPAPLQGLGEGLEDMSLSTASSLDRSDGCEDFLDDSEDLRDKGEVLLVSAHSREGLTQTRPLGDDIPNHRQQASPTQTCRCEEDSAPPSLSSELDRPRSSSLELSPSNSSGGTYMWDEEGLEALCCSQACGSYDSDINPTDVVGRLESCDLEDDDLMLDSDLPEDASLHSDPDGMSHCEHSERGGPQGHWRRRQPRWSGKNHFQNENRRSGPQQGGPGPAVRADGHMGALDLMTLKHMAQDCVSVRAQLLQLRSLLQMEEVSARQGEPFSAVQSPESQEDSSTALQMEELKHELQRLREELKRRDRTIAQLTQQQAVPACAVRCPCQQGAQVGRGERRSHHDKATQTPWRGHAPQVLLPSKPSLGDLHSPQRLANPAPSEGHSEPASVARGNTPPRRRRRPGPDASPDGRPVAKPEDPSLLHGPQLRPGEPRGPTGATGARRTAPQSTSAEHGPPAASPRVLRSPRPHRRAPHSSSPPEGADATPGRLERWGEPGPGGSVPAPKTLPPPSRGLARFSPSLPRARFAYPHPQTQRASGEFRGESS
ncbi:hypothetical protein GJAV_G00236870 [Gymnothorax javanicus]|nr:hypothetical protein GJAV_G00236870 [Gymnothorax javanicus]